MEKTLFEKVSGIQLKGGSIPKEQYTNYLQGKVEYDNSDVADCDCIDCGDCDCDDCPI